MIKLTAAEYKRYMELKDANPSIVEVVGPRVDSEYNYVVTHMPSGMEAKFKYQRQVAQVIGLTKAKVNYMLRRGKHIHGDFYVDVC